MLILDYLLRNVGINKMPQCDVVIVLLKTTENQYKSLFPDILQKSYNY